MEQAGPNCLSKDRQLQDRLAPHETLLDQFKLLETVDNFPR